MKKLLTIILFTLTLTSQAQLARDKQEHLICGSAIGFWASSATVNKKPSISFVYSIGSSALIGGGKELIYDKWMGKGTPEFKDFAWTVAGGATGWAVIQGVRLVSKRIDKKHHRWIE